MSSSPTPTLRNSSHSEVLTEFLTREFDSISTSLLADVSLFCNNAEFKAHRIVLSHYSHFFRAIFESLSGSKHFDVFLEGFDDAEIEAVLTFCYTGNVVWGGGGRGKESIRDVAGALQIPSLQAFLSEPDSIPSNNNNKNEEPDHPHDDASSPVSIWQKCEVMDDEDEPEFASDEDDCFFDYDRKNRPTDSVSKRRKQARPKRHKPTPPHSRSQSPDDLSISDEDEEYTPACSFEDDDDLLPDSRSPVPEPINPDPLTPSSNSPKPIPPPQQQQFPIPSPPSHPHAPPPPHFLFLRNMIPPPHHLPPGAPPPHPPPPHFFPHHAVHEAQAAKKLACGPKSGLWGKLMSKQGGGAGGGVFHHHHGSSRAQHSAPRGGPPRAWSNQDLTEALHNVWNKKMTTSQASRIFGIPYNSLLMYVRGKYGKSLKLDLLKKGLDLALLEKQQQQQKQKTTGSGGQNGGSSSSTSSTVTSSSPRNSNVVEWMMLNSGSGGNKTLDMFHAQGMFFNKDAGFRKGEIGK